MPSRRELEIRSVLGSRMRAPGTRRQNGLPIYEEADTVIGNTRQCPIAFLCDPEIAFISATPLFATVCRRVIVEPWSINPLFEDLAGEVHALEECRKQTRAGLTQGRDDVVSAHRSEEHTSELQSR